MKKTLLILLTFLSVHFGFSQTDRFWKKYSNDRTKIITDKSVTRLSFPKEFKIFELDAEVLNQELFTIVDNSGIYSKIISLPNADGQIEQFEVYEASNFEADLQAMFPKIRAFSGKGITDKHATIKLSISPQGIQTMIFRTDKENEFIEPYSQDHKLYAVFKSNRQKGSLTWTCTTEDQKMAMNISSKVESSKVALSNEGQLKTMRLAQSCNAEYSNYFGATSAAQVNLVLAAYNATLTRCNGVYEKDLALHLNLVASSVNVIYYNPATDPYSTNLGQWNTQLQQALNTTLTGVGTTLAANNAAYDIGHMFGASGGGGNAGCIGCVCVNGVAAGTGATKGRGITSPADGIPQGDNFDIDYVVHEIGHQLGGNHTFSNSNEGAGVSKEVGSGITIMGYAGITQQDVAPHSIDIYHETTIQQIQANLATRSCIVLTSLVGTNATPVVSPMSNYTIPISTPFVLTGAASDSNAADALTYCWEQNDDGGSSTGANSIASATKTVGPNFLSFSPTASPSRYFPKLSSIIANSTTTAATGNDAGIFTEALSSVSRVLNFRLTVRDNVAYSSTTPVKVGQTNFGDMVVNVNAAAGPFVINSPNTAVSYPIASNQTVTWNVAGTTGNNVNSPFVDIFQSTDGGLTYPIQLSNKVPNNGSSIVSIDNAVGTNNRIMVKGYQHIFFDISNTDFATTTATSTFKISQSSVQSIAACSLTSTTYTFEYTPISGFNGTTTFIASGIPPGSTASFSPSTMSNAAGLVTLTLNNLGTATPGNYNMLVNATSGATTKSVPIYLYLGLPNVVLTSPVNNATTQNTTLPLTWDPNPTATSYDVQVASNATFTTIVSSGNVTTNVYNATGLNQGTTYYWRVLPKNATCTGTFGPNFTFTTGQVTCTTTSSTNIPVTIPTTANATVTSTLTIPSGSNISDLNVTLNVSHTWVNDLTITLISPTGVEVKLVQNPCISASLQNIVATFDDSGSSLVCATNPAISGTFIPFQALSAFNGLSAAGTWTLRILDSFAQDGGTINSWSINTCTLSSLGITDNTFKDFTLYPNPNNGNFNIQFNSTSNNPIKIGVYDISGRKVFNKSYQNNGFFNENLQISTLLSGVYLVNIEDGESKIVKRIIIE